MILGPPLHCHRDELRDRLMPLLRGRVFHLTKLSLLPEIIVTGELRANGGERPSTFGSNSFFSKRGYVAVFDYATPTPEQIELSIPKCSFMHLDTLGNAFAALFLTETAACQLLRHDDVWERQQAYRELFVPRVEAGYPSPLPLTLIEEVLEVHVDNPPDPLTEAMTRGREAARARNRSR
jgi:hypothetical protein